MPIQRRSGGDDSAFAARVADPSSVKKHYADFDDYDSTVVDSY